MSIYNIKEKLMRLFLLCPLLFISLFFLNLFSNIINEENFVKLLINSLLHITLITFINLCKIIKVTYTSSKNQSNI